MPRMLNLRHWLSWLPPLLLLALAFLAGAPGGLKPASGPILQVASHIGAFLPYNALWQRGKFASTIPPPSVRTLAPNGGTPSGGVYVEGADNVATAPKLAAQLRLESANSPFTANNTLTPDAIENANQIIAPGDLGNSAIPAGYGKYTTQTYASPSGNFQVHFYENPTTGDVLYDLDYKVVFNAQKVTQP